MQGGWGAMGAGAWGSAPAAPPNDEDSPRASEPPPPTKPTFGSSYRANPVAAPIPPPAATSFNNNNFQSPSFAESSSTREVQLNKREAELQAREAKLLEKQRELEKSGALVPKKNWPICFPIWRHDIAEDIPEKSRRVVREAYMCWYLLILCLTWQFFCACVMLGYGVDNKVPSWFLTIIFWIIGVPLSIWLWYKRIYYAAKEDSTVGYVAFFVFFFVHWAFCVFCAIGLQINAAQWCFSGFIAGFDAFNVNAFCGTIYMIGGALWSCVAIYSMWVLKDAWFFFRGQGGIQEVQKKVATEAALAAFKQGMNGNAANRV